MSDIKQRKLITFFKRWDLDGDGCLNNKDFFGKADRFIKEGNLKSEEAKTIQSQFQRVTDNILYNMVI